jgi:FMN reductase
MAVRLVGLGGSLRASSRSRAALAVALDGAAAAGATIELLDLRQLALPMFNPEHEADAPLAVRAMIETCYAADGMLWSSPMYNGSVSGSFKNAIDWLHLLGGHDPPYLHDRVIGLVSAAGGTQGIQAVNTMEFAVRALRAWAVPYVVPVSRQSFGADGTVDNEGTRAQLRMLGTEVARMAERFAAEPHADREEACAASAERVAAAG